MQAFHDVELPDACKVALAGDIHQDVCHARECRQLVFRVRHLMLSQVPPSLTRLVELTSSLFFGNAVPKFKA